MNLGLKNYLRCSKYHCGTEDFLAQLLKCTWCWELVSFERCRPSQHTAYAVECEECWTFELKRRNMISLNWPSNAEFAWTHLCWFFEPQCKKPDLHCVRDSIQESNDILEKMQKHEAVSDTDYFYGLDEIEMEDELEDLPVPGWKSNEFVAQTTEMLRHEVSESMISWLHCDETTLD